jgi:hypothetical protein
MNQCSSSFAHSRAQADTIIPRTMWGVAILWFGVSAALGANQSFAGHPLLIGPFVVVPLICIAAAFLVSSRLRTWAFALEPKTLVMAQTVRAAGMSFLAVYAVGQLNGLFALWAGMLDCAIGFSAPFAAQYLTPTRTVLQRRLLIAWMIPGIAEFLVAIVLARMARIGDPGSTVALNTLPLSMITTFFVPLALIDYFVLGAQLRQQRGLPGASQPRGITGSSGVSPCECRD